MKYKKENIFLKSYTDPSEPGSFSGISSFYKTLKTKNKNIKIKDVNEWVKSQDTYTLHKSKSKKFMRNQTVVDGINDTWQIDLCDMRAINHLTTISSTFLQLLMFLVKKLGQLS